MQKRFLFSKMLRAILLSFTVLLSGCKTANENGKKTLVLATYTYSTNNRIANLKPLAKVLERQLNKSIGIVSYPDVPSFINAIDSNQVDIGFINTLGYLVLSLDNKNMIPAATLHVKENAKDNYKTVLLGKAGIADNMDSILKKSEELKISFVAPGSTSGNLIPRLFLSSVGIQFPEKQFKQVDYAGNHQVAIDNLVTGKTDVCAVGSNAYHKKIEIDSTLQKSTSVLWISNEIPLGPVLLNKEIPAPERLEIAHILSSLHEIDPEALEAFKAGWSEANQTEYFMPINDTYYQEFRELNGNQEALRKTLGFFHDILFQ